MTIQLSPDLEQVLSEVARRRGTTPELLVNECLRERFVRSTDPGAAGNGSKNLAEYLAGHIGVLRSSDNIPGG